VLKDLVHLLRSAPKYYDNKEKGSKGRFYPYKRKHGGVSVRKKVGKRGPLFGWSVLEGRARQGGH